MDQSPAPTLLYKPHPNLDSSFSSKPTNVASSPMTSAPPTPMPHTPLLSLPGTPGSPADLHRTGPAAGEGAANAHAPQGRRKFHESIAGQNLRALTSKLTFSRSSSETETAQDAPQSQSQSQSQSHAQAQSQSQSQSQSHAQAQAQSVSEGLGPQALPAAAGGRFEGLTEQLREQWESEEEERARKFQEDLVATLGRMGVDLTAEAASFSRTNSSTRVQSLDTQQPQQPTAPAPLHLQHLHHNQQQQPKHHQHEEHRQPPQQHQPQQQPHSRQTQVQPHQQQHSQQEQYQLYSQPQYPQQEAPQRRQNQRPVSPLHPPPRPTSPLPLTAPLRTRPSSPMPLNSPVPSSPVSMTCPSPMAAASPAPECGTPPQYQGFQSPQSVRYEQTPSPTAAAAPVQGAKKPPAPSRFAGAKADGAGGNGGTGSGSTSGSGSGSGKGGVAAGKGAGKGAGGGAGAAAAGAGPEVGGGAPGAGARGEGPSWKRLEPWQIEFLERCFAAGETEVDRERREHLASQLKVKPRQVAVWFQNRRGRWNLESRQTEVSELRASLAALQLSYEKLAHCHRNLAGRLPEAAHNPDCPCGASGVAQPAHPGGSPGDPLEGGPQAWQGAARGPNTPASPRPGSPWHTVGAPASAQVPSPASPCPPQGPLGALPGSTGGAPLHGAPLEAGGQAKVQGREEEEEGVEEEEEDVKDKLAATLQIISSILVHSSGAPGSRGSPAPPGTQSPVTGTGPSYSVTIAGAMGVNPGVPVGSSPGVAEDCRGLQAGKRRLEDAPMGEGQEAGFLGAAAGVPPRYQGVHSQGDGGRAAKAPRMEWSSMPFREGPDSSQPGPGYPPGTPDVSAVARAVTQALQQAPVPSAGLSAPPASAPPASVPSTPSPTTGNPLQDLVAALKSLAAAKSAEDSGDATGASAPEARQASVVGGSHERLEGAARGSRRVGAQEAQGGLFGGGVTEVRPLYPLHGVQHHEIRQEPLLQQIGRQPSGAPQAEHERAPPLPSQSTESNSRSTQSTHRSECLQQSMAVESCLASSGHMGTGPACDEPAQICDEAAQASDEVAQAGDVGVQQESGQDAFGTAETAQGWAEGKGGAPTAHQWLGLQVEGPAGASTGEGRDTAEGVSLSPEKERSTLEDSETLPPPLIIPRPRPPRCPLTKKAEAGAGGGSVFGGAMALSPIPFADELHQICLSPHFPWGGSVGSPTMTSPMGGRHRGRGLATTPTRAFSPYSAKGASPRAGEQAWGAVGAPGLKRGQREGSPWQFVGAFSPKALPRDCQSELRGESLGAPRAGKHSRDAAAQGTSETLNEGGLADPGAVTDPSALWN